MLAAWLHTLDPEIIRIGPLALKWYGLSYVLSAVFGYFLYRRLAERKYTDVAPVRVEPLIMYVLLFGVMLGGRVGWILFYGLKQSHAGDPFWCFKVWEGGMSSHGGILGIVVVTYIISRRWKISWTSIGDSLCVVAPVGLFLVRCANFINGELYGHETNAAWAVKFPQEITESRSAAFTDRVFAAVEPHHAILARYGDGPDWTADWTSRVAVAVRHEPAIRAAIEPVLTPRHPSQLYEALLEGALLFVILWPLRTRCRMPRGAITGLFFILYAAARIGGEVFRVPDPAWSVGKMSPGQFLSLFMFAIGAAFLAWAWRARQYEAADRRETPPAAPSAGR